MAIRKLTRVIVETSEDGTQTTRLPNNQEIMNKINEIVDFCNRLEREKQDKPVGFGKPVFGSRKGG
ncbi:hypothetical protein [Bacillus mojavensis]